MDFIIKNVKENILQVARKIGYVIIDTKDGGEHNLVKKIAYDNYPRYHAYVTVKGTDLLFSFHLDQKAPVYAGGGHAHSGEYWGPVVENEADRIREILK